MKTPVFSYQKKNTLVHNAPASVKLAVQFLLCFFLFLRTGSEKAEITVLAFCTAVIAAAFILARLRFQDLGKLSFVLCIGGLYAVFKIFRLDFSGTEDGQFRLPAGTQEGIPLLFGIIEIHREEVRSAFLYAFRFFMSALAALIFFHTTPPVHPCVAAGMEIPILSFLPEPSPHPVKRRRAARRKNAFFILSLI